MKDDEFTKLFKYMQEMRQDLLGQMNGRFDTLESDVDQLRITLDGIAEVGERDELSELRSLLR
jgi:hypothetical protein